MAGRVLGLELMRARDRLIVRDLTSLELRTKLYILLMKLCQR